MDGSDSPAYRPVARSRTFWRSDGRVRNPDDRDQHGHGAPAGPGPEPPRGWPLAPPRHRRRTATSPRASGHLTTPRPPRRGMAAVPRQLRLGMRGSTFGERRRTPLREDAVGPWNSRAGRHGHRRTQKGQAKRKAGGLGHGPGRFRPAASRWPVRAVSASGQHVVLHRNATWRQTRAAVADDSRGDSGESRRRPGAVAGFQRPHGECPSPPQGLRVTGQGRRLTDRGVRQAVSRSSRDAEG